MIELVVINLYGTILPLEGKLHVRKGFDDFLIKNSSKHIAISAYESKEKVRSDMKSCNLTGKVSKIYTLEKMKYFPFEKIHIPDIKCWACVDFKSSETRTVYVTSDPRDLEGASWYGIKAVQIPTFNNEDDTFSFDTVTIDSLASKIQYFFQRCSDKPQRILLK